MIALSCRRGAAGEQARDNHKPFGPYFLGVGGVGDSSAGIHRTSTYNNRHACLDERGYTSLALIIGEQWPIPHGAAIDGSIHAGLNEFLALAHKGLSVWGTHVIAGRH